MQEIAACGESSIPDNNSNGTDSVQNKSGDNPQDKCVEELEQDYKKVVQKEPPIDQRLRVLQFLNKKNGTR